MSQDTDFSRHSEYFTARADEERQMAMATKHPHVRAIHLEMADRYAEAASAAAQAPAQPFEEPQQAG